MLRAIGKFIWRFMVIFSFIVNIVLVVVLIALGILIFEIKDNVADPLIGGLYSTAEGLENATIDWTIPVRDNIPVNLDIQLETDTVVVLTAPVPLQVDARIDLPGINAYNVAASVNLQLPAGLELPVSLDVPVPVRERLDVALDVRAVIPLSQTQLRDPIQTLGLLFEPLALALHNLPEDFQGGGQMVGDVLAGQSVDLFAASGSPYNDNGPFVPWTGYSITAGENYELLGAPVPPEHIRRPTGIVPPGGIPFLDAQLDYRAFLYENGMTPAQYNAQQLQNLAAQGIPALNYNGNVAQAYLAAQGLLPPDGGDVNVDSQATGGQPPLGPTPTPVQAIGGPEGAPPVDDLGILPSATKTP